MLNMLLKYIFVFAILTVCTLAMVQSQELLFNQQQSISYHGSVLPENSGTSTSPQPAPINSGIPLNYQSVPVNNGFLTASQSSPIYSGNSIKLQFPPLGSGTSIGFEFAPVDSSTSINLQPAPISSGTSIDSQSVRITSGTTIDSRSTPTNAGPSIDLQPTPITSGSSKGLQLVPLDSGTTTDSQSAEANPNIELFAHTMLQLLQSSNVFGSHGTFPVYEPYSIVFDVGYNILKRAGIIDPTAADLIAQAAEDIALLSSDLYYSTMAHMLAKFLDVNRVLTKDVAVNGPRKVMDVVEDYANEYGVYDT